MAELLPVLKKLTVAELQSELKSRGLKKSGTKAVLINRLYEHLKLNAEVPEEEEEEEEVLTNEIAQEEDLPIQENPDDKDKLVENVESNVLQNNSEPVGNDDTNENNDGDDVRNFTEELTEPIHQNIQDSPIVGERIVAMVENPQMESEDEQNDIDQTSVNTLSPPVVSMLSPPTVNDKEGSNLSFAPEEEANDVDMDVQQTVTNEKEKDEHVEDDETPITNVLHYDEEENKQSSHQDEEILDYEEFDDEEESSTSKVDGNVVDIHVDVKLSEKEDLPNDEKVKSDVEDGVVEEEKEIVVEKPKPIIVKPVILKKRVSLQASIETSEERAAKRKRRWGSTTAMKESSFAISSDSIKKLIPDVKIDVSDLDNIPQLDYEEEESENKPLRIVDVDAINPIKESPKKLAGRTVKVDSVKKVVLGKKRENTDPVVINSDTETEPRSAKQSLKTLSSLDVHDDDEIQEEREKSPSPPKHDLSAFLHIENLVRPFTINQLKNLVGKTGTICEKGFWINNIKSHCYVKLSSEEEATATREALHGLKWPSGNPKLLRVDFALPDQMYKVTEGFLGEKAKVVVEIQDEDEEQKEEKKEEMKEEKEEEQKDNPPKETRKKRERKTSDKVKEKKKEINRKEKEESPAKLLDDLFRKTKATPCIYWLPLSDEEILNRKKDKENQSDKTQNRERERPERRRSPERRPGRPADNRRPARTWR